VRTDPEPDAYRWTEAKQAWVGNAGTRTILNDTALFHASKDNEVLATRLFNALSQSCGIKTSDGDWEPNET
jgi:hypothetical protein